MNENERWQMYGLQAIERVNAKRMVWCEFAEAMRVLKLRVEKVVLEHLQQKEKDPDSTFVDSLMELHQNTENHELQCILNYLFHWRLEDPLESAAEAFFSCPPSHMYSVKATGERFRSFEADHKIAYQGFLEKNL
jgi:5-methylcytosine-specific restriction endonuclease McrA